MGELINQFAQSVKFYRKARGMTTTELSLSIFDKPNHAYIIGIEKGRQNPTIKTMEMIAEKLDFTIDFVDNKRRQNLE